MTNYIDGFVMPIPLGGIDEYRRVAEAVAEIYKEHGALDYLEFIGDDMHREGTQSFENLVDSSAGEVVVFGWIHYESREARDKVNAKVEADPRMPGIIAPLLDPPNPIFDANRMAYGGFNPLFKTANNTTE